MYLSNFTARVLKCSPETLLRSSTAARRVEAERRFEMQIAIIRIHVYLIGFGAAVLRSPDRTATLVKVKQEKKRAAISQSAVNGSADH